MAIREQSIYDPDVELFYANVAEDFGRYGKTEKKCPVCGKPFIFRQIGSSYELRCETDHCTEIVSRGI